MQMHFLCSNKIRTLRVKPASISRLCGVGLYCRAKWLAVIWNGQSGDQLSLMWCESSTRDMVGQPQYFLVFTSLTGPQFNIKMSSYQYRKSYCGDKTVVRSSYLHNGIFYTGKMTSLYWIRAQDLSAISILWQHEASWFVILTPG